MSSKKRDALKVAIFEGTPASIQLIVGDCCKSLGMAKTIGTVIGIWATHYLSPNDDALKWGYTVWKEYRALVNRTRRAEKVARLLQLVHELAALPMQAFTPSFNSHETWRGDCPTTTANDGGGDAAAAAASELVRRRIKKYAVRDARPYLHEWVRTMHRLKKGLDDEAQEVIWRILNSVLASGDMSRLKAPLKPRRQRQAMLDDDNDQKAPYTVHVLALIWDILLTENACLGPLHDLFMCSLAMSSQSITERLPILYVTCLYHPLITAFFSELYTDADADTNADGQKNEAETNECWYMFADIAENQ